MDEWKHEYAESLTSNGYRNVSRVVLHHVNSKTEGRAQCASYIQLDMATLTTLEPSEEAFCSNCWTIYKRWQAANRAAILDLQSLATSFDKRGRSSIGDIAREEIERRQATLANR